MKTVLATFVLIFLFQAQLCATEKPKSGMEVLVVADAVRDVPEGLRPSPGKPVYYVLLGQAEFGLGNILGGVKPPDRSLIEKAVVESLGSQGFVRTGVGGPIPSICIVVGWGDASFHDFDQPPPPKGSPEDLIRLTTIDRAKVETLMGTNKPGTERMNFSDQQKVVVASNEDRIYLLIVALDAAELRKRNKKMLWRTSMSIDWRNKLDDSIPVMLASAAPFFGLNADTPALVDDNVRRNAKVEVGELKVIRDEPTSGSSSERKK